MKKDKLWEDLPKLYIKEHQWAQVGWKYFATTSLLENRDICERKKLPKGWVRYFLWLCNLILIFILFFCLNLALILSKQLFPGFFRSMCINSMKYCTYLSHCGVRTTLRHVVRTIYVCWCHNYEDAFQWLSFRDYWAENQKGLAAKVDVLCRLKLASNNKRVYGGRGEGVEAS